MTTEVNSSTERNPNNPEYIFDQIIPFIGEVRITKKVITVFESTNISSQYPLEVGESFKVMGNKICIVKNDGEIVACSDRFKDPLFGEIYFHDPVEVQQMNTRSKLSIV